MKFFELSTEQQSKFLAALVNRALRDMAAHNETIMLRGKIFKLDRLVAIAVNCRAIYYKDLEFEAGSTPDAWADDVWDATCYAFWYDMLLPPINFDICCRLMEALGDYADITDACKFAHIADFLGYSIDESLNINHPGDDPDADIDWALVNESRWNEILHKMSEVK